ncbi:uncharacterized protein METZ01_LOCUS221028, partial [marine metagenome]
MGLNARFYETKIGDCWFIAVDKYLN